MRKEKWIKKWDMILFRRILDMKSDSVKEYFNREGCGLEIEFGIRYEYRSRHYIRAGLRKMKDLVGNKGKFVPDMTIASDFNVEIVLMPMGQEALSDLFYDIKNIIEFYQNFVFDSYCGIHANFRADENMKRKFYHILVNGGYDSKRFVHTKYKMDFMDIVNKPSGALMTYDEYLNFQNRICSKYTGVNFLKKDLVEFRSLDLNWKDIEYVFNLYERAKQAHEIQIAFAKQ